MSDQDILNDIIARYRAGGAEALTADDRVRLSGILASAEGRRLALSSSCPEIIFMTEETHAEPAWDSYWRGFETRMGYHIRQQAKQSTAWLRTAAMAAVLIVLIGVAFVLFAPSVNAPASGERVSRAFVLEHVRPADILPRIRDLLSEDAGISVDPAGSGLTIEDTAENLERVQRSLAQLDRQPLTYALDVRLLRPRSAIQSLSQRVDGVPAREFDFGAYDAIETFALSPVESRQLRETIDDRWEIACYLQAHADGVHATLVSFSIYDREKREITMRTTALELAPGMVRTLDTGLTAPDGSPLIVSFTLDGKR
jgi:hypothetical protein